MEPKNFTGQCEAESTFGGNPVGTKFSSKSVAFTQRSFDAHDGVKIIRLHYHEELKAGVHSLIFSGNSNELPALEYDDGKGSKNLSGTANITIGENLDSQAGTFDGVYFDAIGRLISFKGVFSAKYEL